MVRLFVVMLCSAAVAVAAPVPKPVPVEDLIRDFAGADEKKRDAAEDALWHRGYEAIAPLKKLRYGKDIEKGAADRAERLLDKLMWGLHGDAPKAVAEALERYHSRTERDLRVPRPPPEADVELIETVALLGKPGAESVRAIAQTISEEGGRGPDRWRLVQIGVRRAVGRLLFDGKDDDAAAVLAVTLPEKMQPDWRTYRIDRGLKVDEENPAVAKVPKSVDERAEARVKAFTPADRVRLLAAQLKFADALKVVAPPKNKDDWRAWAAARADVLLTVGRTTDADKLLGDELFDPPNSLPAIKVEMAHGRADRAFGRVGQWLAEPENRTTGWAKDRQGNARTLWGLPDDPAFAEALFPGRRLAASSVWAAFRKDRSAEKALTVTRRLMAGTATADEYKTAVKLLSSDTHTVAVLARAANDVPTLERALRDSSDHCRPQYGAPPRPLGLTVVENAAFFGPYHAHADTIQPILDWGRYLSDLGKHHAAAAVYFDGWEKFPNSPVLLYLSGTEKVAAGMKKEGGRQLHLAFRLSLSDGDVWAEFLQQLLLADAPAELLKRAADRLSERPPQSMLVGAKAFHLATTAYRKCGAFEAAAKAEERAAKCWAASGWEHAMLTGDPRTLSSSVQSDFDPPPLPHPADYMRLTATPKLNRSLELLAAKQPAEAKKLAAEYFAVLPGDVTQAVRVVTAFDKAGAKAEADELFAVVRDPLAAAVKEYPEAKGVKKALDELRAGCGR